MNKIKIGHEYDTQLCYETVRVIVNSIIDNSYPNQHYTCDNSCDNACSVTIVGTKHNLLRRISELQPILETG